MTNIKWLSIPVTFGLVILIGLVTLTPVTLETESEVGQGELDRREWERIPSGSYSRLIIKNLSSRPIDLAYPELRWPERFSPDLIAVTKGALVNEATERIWFEPGGITEIRGVYGDIGVTLPGESQTESVATRWRSGGETISIELNRAEPRVLFQSQSERFTRTLPFLWRGIGPSDYGARGAVEVRVGSDEFQPGPGEAIGVATLLKSSLKGVLGGLLLVAAALAMCALMWFLGYLIIGRPDIKWTRGVHLAVGFGVVAIAANTLSYLFTIQVTAALLTAGLVGFCAVRGTSLRVRGVLAQMGGDARAFGRSLIIALIPGTLLFFPIFYSAGPFLGGFKTDLTVNASLAASFLKDLSLVEMQSSSAVQNLAPELWFAPGMGFSWRSIDTVFASLLSLGGQDTNAGFELGAIVLFFVYAVTILQVASCRSRSWPTKVIAALLLFYPPVTTLYLEFYWSQYMLAAILPGLVWAGVNVSLSSRGGRIDAGPAVSVAVLFAAAFLAYPHFALVVAGGLILIYVGVQVGLARVKRKRGVAKTWREAADASGRGLLKVVLLAALFIGPGLLLVQGLNSGEYVEGLDQILFGVLLAPYSSLQELGLAAGTVPYIWRGAFIEPASYMGGVGHRVWGTGIDSMQSLLPTALVLGLAGAAFIWAMQSVKTLSRGQFPGIAAIVLTLGLVGLLLSLGGNSYGAFKIGWTAICLVPLLVVSMSLEAKRSVLVVVALIPISLLWIRTDAVERVTWITDPDSPELAAAHSFLQKDVREAQAVLRELQPRRVEIIEGRQPLRETNNDLILFHQTIRMARDQGIKCQSCVRVRALEACPTGSDAIVTIGRVDMAEMCGLSRIYQGQNIEVFGRPSRSGAQL